MIRIAFPTPVFPGQANTGVPWLVRVSRFRVNVKRAVAEVGAAASATEGERPAYWRGWRWADGLHNLQKPHGLVRK